MLITVGLLGAFTLAGPGRTSTCRVGLDHVLIYGRRHLERVLKAYVDHYVKERPHRGLGLAVPAGDRVPKIREPSECRSNDETCSAA